MSIYIYEKNSYRIHCSRFKYKPTVSKGRNILSLNIYYRVLITRKTPKN